MTDNEAIEFLKTVQPLPDDSELSEELIAQYDEVRKHFIKSPNELAVPLLLNSFGDGDGFGVYQLVEDAIAGKVQRRLSCIQTLNKRRHPTGF